MSDTLRVCVFDAGGAHDPPFINPFLKLEKAQVIGQASTWEELRDWLRSSSIELVVVNLDDESGVGLSVIERIGQAGSPCAILGVSARTDPSFIIAAMRAGCSQFVTWPIDPEDLKNAVNRIRASKRVVTQSSKRVCVIGSSGGVGATTIACNLAMELAHLTDRNVALVDMNLEFGDIGCAFDCTPTYSIADVCRDGVDVDHMMLEKALHALPSQVSIMARPERIEAAREIAPENVLSMMKLLADMHPYVVVDLPRTFSFLSAAAVHEAERLLIVTQLSVPCIRNATRIYQCLAQMNADEDRIEVVLNRCNANFERITPDEIEAHFKRPIFAMVPNDYRRIQTSLDLGQPVMHDSPNGPAKLAIQEMARKLTGDFGADELTPAASNGLWSKLWGRGPKART